MRKALLAAFYNAMAQDFKGMLNNCHTPNG